jgi:choline-sulfatase
MVAQTVRVSEDAPAESSSASDRVSPWYFSAVVTSLAFASGESFAASRASGGHGAIAAGVEAALVTFPLVVAITAGAARILSARQVRVAGAGVAATLSGGRPWATGPLVLLAALLIAGALEVAHFMGIWLAAHVSPRMAADASIGAATVSLALALLTLCLVGPAATTLYLKAGRRVAFLRPLVAPDRAAICLALALGVCSASLPRGYAFAPAGAALGLVVALVGIDARIHETRRPPRLALLVFPLMLAAVAFLRVMPDDARLAVTVRSPYASLVVGALRAMVDRDHDGYSPILMGGDCDDGNAQVHPGAHDVPDNGVDENCSGADAHRAALPPSPTPPRPEGLPARMNVVLVHLDALRPDHLGFAGYARPTSPRLDRFRAGATWFSRTYTPAPNTRYAMASAFTGLAAAATPHRLGDGMDFTLLPSATTFAERLADAGYDRAGFSISYVVQHITGIGQGFRVWETPWPVDEWARTYPTAATLTTEAAIGYLAGQTGPFVLFTHYQCTHDPYSGRANFGSADVDRYDSAAAYCDEEVGRLLDALDTRDDAARTAVIVYSDHGELFGEHGLTSHGGSLYEPDVRALLLVRLPGGSARVVDAPVSLTDLAPTVLDLASALPRDGSLVPAAVDPARAPHGPIFLLTDLHRGTIHYHARGVVDGRYKYIDDGTAQIYDVLRDPGERTNLVDVLPTERARLAELLENAAP